MSRLMLLGLILCNAVWAVNPTMGKLLLAQHPPEQVAWLRSFSALLSAWMAVPFFRRFQPRYVTPLSTSFRGSNLRWLAALGFFTFFFSTTFQFVGLAGTTATANVLIVAIEPLVVVVMAWLFVREKIGTSDALAFFISILGFCLLSNLNPGDIGGSASLFNLGNLILFLTMFTDSAYSVISRKLRGRVAPFSVFACSLPFGFTMITLYVFFTGKGFPSFPSLSKQEWLALLWLGPLGTTVTYAYWSKALASTSVSAVSLTLFAQPILGTMAGIFFLGEHLNPLQWAGAALMLAALGMQTSVEMRKSEA